MRWRSGFAFALMAGLVVPAVAHGQDSRPGIAIWAFENGGSYGQDSEDFEALRVGLQQILITELARNSSMRVVERSHLNELIREQDLGAAGRVDANTAARVGNLVGARYMVLGGFVDFYGDFRIDARIVNVETGTVELYDLELDPGETDDRSEQDPERADRLAAFATARYAELEASASSARSGGLLDADRTDLEGLRALGYLDDAE